MTEENTPVEEQVSEANMTLAEELKKGFEEQNNAVQHEEVEQEIEQEINEEEVVEEEIDEIEQEVEKEFPLIPKEMSKDEQEAFRALLESGEEDKRIAAEIFIERYNNLKKGFYNKTQKYAEDTREFKEINKALESRKHLMEQSGISSAQYLENLIGWETKFAQDPVQAIKEVIQQRNIDINDIIPDSSNDFDFEIDSESKDIKTLKQEVQNLRNQLANQPVEQQIRQFAQATDSEGKLKHPHFEEVKTIMGSLISSGKAQDLEDAYQRATRTLQIDEEPTPEVDLDKIREKVAKAKKATKGLKTSGNRPDFTKMSLQDELKARAKGLN